MVNRVIAHLGGRTPCAPGAGPRSSARGAVPGAMSTASAAEPSSAPLLRRYVLHRLDAPTSGLLLFAKSVVAARDIQRQFRKRFAQKTYLAVLLGDVTDDRFVVDAPIAVDPHDKTLSVVVPEPPPESPQTCVGGRSLEYSLVGRLSRDQLPLAKRAALLGLQGKPSLTEFEVVGRSAHATACKVSPITGRMHQIRIHAELAGHPLAGDTQYGLKLQPTDPRCQRLLLHAHSLRISHPTRQQLVTFTAAPPAEYGREAEVLGLAQLAELAPSGFAWGGPTPDDAQAESSLKRGWRHRERKVKRR